MLSASNDSLPFLYSLYKIISIEKSRISPDYFWFFSTENLPSNMGKYYLPQ